MKASSPSIRLDGVLDAVAAPLGLDGASILVVDDYPPNLLALEAILKPLGQKLVTALSGEEALERARSEDFAVVLMDVRLPGIGGVETTQRLRALERNRSTPVILLTANDGGDEEIRDGYAHGAVDHLRKPFSAEVLLSKVSVFVELFLAKESVRRKDAQLRAEERDKLTGILQQHQQELKQVEAERQLFFQLAPDMFCVAGLDAQLKRINPAFSATLGWSEQELSGCPFTDLVHPENVAETSAEVGKLSRGTDTVRFVNRYRCKDGSYKWLDWAAVAVPELGLLYAAARDITEQQRAEERVTEALARERAARADAEDQKTLLRLLIEQSGDAIIMADELGVLRVFNPEAEKLHGVAQQQLQAPEWAEAYGLYDVDGARLRLEDTPLFRAVNGETVRGAEWLVKRPDGTTRFLGGTASPLRRQDGTPAGGVLIARDETERRAVAEEQARRARRGALFGEVGLMLTRSREMGEVLQGCCESLVQHLDAAFARIWLLDEAEQVLELRASAGLYTHLDGPHGKVPVGKFKIGLIAAERKPHLTNAVTGDPRVGDQEWAKREKMVAFAGYPMMVGERLVGVLAMFARKPLPVDTLEALRRLTESVSIGTRRILAEEEIRQLNQSLERRVEERTMELRDVNRELESFSYSVSHDLRAPLRHIAGFAQLLEKRAADTLDDKSKGYVRTVAEAAQRGGQLVDDLLSFSRMGRSEIHTSNVSLQQLFDEARKDLEPDLADRKIEWKVAPLPAVYGDAAMLRMVIKNLLANAVKYTRPRDPALIEVGASEESGEVHVWFKDNGVGFDMQHADKLFGVFQRLHTAEQFEGTGIGLANVRRIVTRHRGRVWADGAPNQGATFHFALPVHSPTGKEEI